MIEMTQAEVDEARAEAEGVSAWPACTETGTWRALATRQARAVRHLAARQMPALRWEGRHGYLGGLKIASILIGDRGPDQWFAIIRGADNWPEDLFSSESEARAAVEAAVRKELGVGQ